MERDEILSKLNDIFRDVFDDECLMITEQTNATDIEDWDSLAQMTLISSIEGEFGLQFKMKDIVGLEKVGDVIDLIQKYSES